jgi:cytochrome c biogenesis protein CcmG/thiol:disulfide interchange protein DsbE
MSDQFEPAPERFDFPSDPPAGSPAPERGGASRARWIVAAASAVAVALFAVPLLLSDGPGPAIAGGAPPAAACSNKTGDANLDFTVKDMHGADVRLADFKGKVILLNFWATWCGPCKVEIPAFIELYDRYKKDGFVVLGVSGDDDAETLRAFASEWKMNYPVLVGRDHEDLLDAFGPLWGYPTTFIIGRDGAICGKHMGPATKEQFAREIKALL